MVLRKRFSTNLDVMYSTDRSRRCSQRRRERGREAGLRELAVWHSGGEGVSMIGPGELSADI